MGGDGALGDEQASSDLLVAEPLGDESGHLDLPFGEGSGLGATRCNDAPLIRFVKSEPNRGLAAEPFACLEFSFELRLPQGSSRRLSGLSQQRGMRSTVVCAGTRANARCGPEQPGCASRLARTRGMPPMTTASTRIAPPSFSFSYSANRWLPAPGRLGNQWGQMRTEFFQFEIAQRRGPRLGDTVCRAPNARP